MSEQYLTMLTENLKRKCDVLDEIIRISKHQQEILAAQPCDYEKFDTYVDDKDICMEQIQELEEKFDRIYHQVEEVLKESKEAYASQILQCKNLTAQIMDKSAEVQALETENRKSLEAVLQKERKDIGLGKRSVQVVKNYYRNMSGLDTLPSQYLDKKK